MHYSFTSSFGQNGRPGDPGSATVRDIADRALCEVNLSDRERILVALENSRACPQVDPDALSSSLRHLIERAIHARSPQILLRGRHDDGGTCFAVVSYTEAASTLPADSLSNGRFAKALQSVTGLGGTLSVEHTAAGHTHATIEVRGGWRHDA